MKAGISQSVDIMIPKILFILPLNAPNVMQKSKNLRKNLSQDPFFIADSSQLIKSCFKLDMI
jgi:hypothetical protein